MARNKKNIFNILFDIAEISVYNVHMKRINHHLTNLQIKQMRELSRQTGLSVAELIRRAIDEYIKKQKGGLIV